MNEEIFYEPGESAQIRVGENFMRRFKVKKPFKVHGYRDGKVVVTLPLTLETLKGLGFISSLKGG